MWMILLLIAAWAVADPGGDVSIFEPEVQWGRIVVTCVLIVAAIAAYYIESRYDD